MLQIEILHIFICSIIWDGELRNKWKITYITRFLTLQFVRQFVNLTFRPPRHLSSTDRRRGHREEAEHEQANACQENL